MFPYLLTTRAAWSPWRQMFATRPSLRSVMISHGNKAKKIWATEYGAPTGGDRAVSGARQAPSRRPTGSGAATAGLDRFKSSIRDRGAVTWHTTCGLVREDYSAKASYTAYRTIANAAR